jgi:hypothetical protein
LIGSFQNWEGSLLEKVLANERRIMILRSIPLEGIPENRPEVILS